MSMSSHKLPLPNLHRLTGLCKFSRRLIGRASAVLGPRQQLGLMRPSCMSESTVS